MKKPLLQNCLLLLFFVCMPAQAQTEKSKGTFMQQVVKLFSETDTTYISPNRYNLTVMAEQSFWYERYRLKAHLDNQTQSISLAPSVTPKIGAYFGWRWIFLGMSFSIPDLIGKSTGETNKEEYVFNLYSARIGLDLYYRKTGNDFRITSYSNFNLPDTYIGQKFEGFQSKIVGLNAYWIFNNKKFSYPAVVNAKMGL